MRNLTFKLGANVYGRNKHCGQLIKFVIDPHNRQLTDLIIEEGLLFKRALVLPVSQVKETHFSTRDNRKALNKTVQAIFNRFRRFAQIALTNFSLRLCVKFFKGVNQ